MQLLIRTLSCPHLLAKKPSSATRRVINSMHSGKIKPLYNDEILAKYFDVLSRSKFHLNEVRINELLYFIKQNGIDSSRFPYDGTMPDEDDRVFYEVCLSKEDSFLVTGNLKHFPKEPQVITAVEMIEILATNYKIAQHRYHLQTRYRYCTTTS